MTESRLKNRFAQSRFTGVDAAALLAFAVMWIFYCVIVRYSTYIADEITYISVAERFALGDRPIVDDWNLAQLSCGLLILPYKLYVAIKGSTAGIVLFMRYLFLAFNAVFYWFMYIRLRTYRWFGLAASMLFSIYVPFGFFSFNYYTTANRLLMIACLILFSENPKRLPLVLAGILLACSVLYQPGFSILYFLFTVPVWIRFFRQKKGKPFLDGFAFCLQVRVWAYVTLGVVLSACAVLTWLISKSGLAGVLQYLPMLFTDPDFTVTADGTVKHHFIRKIVTVAQIYTPVCWVPALAILALSVAYACGKLRGRHGAARQYLFGASCVIWILSCILPFVSARTVHMRLFFTVYPFPMFWLGIVCFLLTEKKNKRILYFWAVSLAASLCVDILSGITESLGSPIAYIADLVFFGDLIRELREARPHVKIGNTTQLWEQKKEKTLSSVVRALTAAATASMAAWFVFSFSFLNTVGAGFIVMHNDWFSFPVHCDAGPCMGFRYPASYGSYSGKLSDIDAIRKNHPKNLYICGTGPELYMYAGLPYATYSPGTYNNTIELINRHIKYWKIHPDRLPDCIYIPFDDLYNAFSKNECEQEDSMASFRRAFDPICTYTEVPGKSGMTLYVTQWAPDMQNPED